MATGSREGASGVTRRGAERRARAARTPRPRLGPPRKARRNLPQGWTLAPAWAIRRWGGRDMMRRLNAVEPTDLDEVPVNITASRSVRRRALVALALAPV